MQLQEFFPLSPLSICSYENPGSCKSYICSYKKNGGGAQPKPRSKSHRSFTLNVVDSTLVKTKQQRLLENYGARSAFFFVSPFQLAAQGGDSARAGRRCQMAVLLDKFPVTRARLTTWPTAAAVWLLALPMAASWYFSTAGSEHMPKANKKQSLSVLNLKPTVAYRLSPGDIVWVEIARQTYFLGLAFSIDGKTLVRFESHCTPIRSGGEGGGGEKKHRLVNRQGKKL